MDPGSAAHHYMLRSIRGTIPATNPRGAFPRGFSFAARGVITAVLLRNLSTDKQSRDAMTDRRPLLRAIFDAAVAAAHPDVVLSAHLRPVPKGKIICLAAGKGAAAMAAAAERYYLDELKIDPTRLLGLATTRHGHGVPARRIKVVEAGHPVPDEAGLKAADETLALAQTAGADDLLLVLLSGGGSANWIAPAEGVSF